MNNPRIALLAGIVTLSLLGLPVAAADPLDEMHVEKDFAAHYAVDYSDALEGVDDVKSLVDEAKAHAETKATAKTTAGAEATTGAGSGLLASFRSNLNAFASWAKSLSVKPSPEASGEATATNAQEVVTDVRSLDGTIEGDVYGHLEATNVLQKNVPPPPTPDVGFLGSMKAAFRAFLGIE